MHIRHIGLFVCLDFCLLVPVQVIAWKDSSPKWPARRKTTHSLSSISQSINLLFRQQAAQLLEFAHNVPNFPRLSIDYLCSKCGNFAPRRPILHL